MDWVLGMQKAIDYIEENLTDELDYTEIAKRAYCSCYHFQRVFGIMCGYTIGEYIRNRRLTLAGNELASSNEKVIDVALKYGYDSPESFARAFSRFHGLAPSLARDKGAKLKSFSRLTVKLIMEGGNTMNYRIEEKGEMIFTGYKRRFTGVPGERREQEKNFFVQTRTNQYILIGLSHDCDTQYSIIKNIDDDGYDFYIAALLPSYMREHIQDQGVLGTEDAKRFEEIHIPAQTYAVFETEQSKIPALQHMDLRKKIVTEWLPSSGYILAEASEITVSHWYMKPSMDSRYIEIWMPVEKK